MTLKRRRGSLPTASDRTRRRRLESLELLQMIARVCHGASEGVPLPKVAVGAFFGDATKEQDFITYSAK